MKLKYYLRGLGIGIFITTIILSISFKGRKESLTDEEIIQRAQELGMVQQEETEDSKEIVKKADVETSENQEDKKNVKQPMNKDQEDKIQEDKDQEDKEQSKEESKPEDSEQAEEEVESASTKKREMVQIDIVGGMSSDAIAQALFNAQLVDDAITFNHFLIENNYDKNLLVGSFAVPKEATYEEIAKILTTK